MIKYFVKCTTELIGTEEYHVIDAINEEDAKQQAEELAYDNYTSYENGQEDDDEDWIDDEHYEYTLELYNPEEHDKYL